MQIDTKIFIKSIYIPYRIMLLRLLCSDVFFTSVDNQYTQRTHPNKIIMKI